MSTLHIPSIEDYLRLERLIADMMNCRKCSHILRVLDALRSDWQPRLKMNCNAIKVNYAQHDGQIARKILTAADVMHVGRSVCLCWMQHVCPKTPPLALSHAVWVMNSNLFAVPEVRSQFYGINVPVLLHRGGRMGKGMVHAHER